jgi:hypothetical protein
VVVPPDPGFEHLVDYVLSCEGFNHGSVKVRSADMV